MSVEAAGITVSLYALSELSFHYSKGPFADKYHLLRDFVLGHPDEQMIFRAID